jgi:hypothetical protein
VPDFQPYACLECRRSFKRPRTLGGPLYRPCPLCGRPAVALHPDFKPPRSADLGQWDKVRYLVEHGFRFRPIWDPARATSIPYPDTLRDAVAWVDRWQHLPITRGGPLPTPPAVTPAAGRDAPSPPAPRRRARPRRSNRPA